MAVGTKRPTTDKDEKELMVNMWSPVITENPYNFVMFAYPWGQPGTPLEFHSGPRGWQKEMLLEITEHIKKNKARMEMGLSPLVYKASTASGRGIGKSAIVGWLSDWMMSCQIGSTTIITANTESQLKTRTFAEVSKWTTLLINNHWFEQNVMSIKPAPWYDESLKRQLKVDTGYHYCQAQLWSEENPDSFAGAHNEKGMLLFYDEASGIPAPIWQVSSGFFTEPILHRYWIVFSNPRRNTGAFFECFHKNRDNWNLRNIDGRTVEGTDKQVYEEIINEHGEDSDAARVEVKGQFPRQGDNQFISREVVAGAVERVVPHDAGAPLIMGIDTARFGDDTTVFAWRKGRDAKSIPAVKLKGMDSMEVANSAAHWIIKTEPDAVCIDAGGAGAGIVDRLKEMGYHIHEVWFGAPSKEDEWANVRIELWDKMRAWLGGAMIPNDQHLIDDLVSPEFGFTKGGDKQVLEAKEKMKKRGLASPDYGDALACTFAVNVARKDKAASKQFRRNRGPVPGTDYKMF